MLFVGGGPGGYENFHWNKSSLRKMMWKVDSERERRERRGKEGKESLREGARKKGRKGREQVETGAKGSHQNWKERKKGKGGSED